MNFNRRFIQNLWNKDFEINVWNYEKTDLWLDELYFSWVKSKRFAMTGR